MVIDVDKAADEQAAKLLAQRENEEKNSKSHLITTIKSESLASSLAKVKANRELEREGKRQNEEALLKHLETYIIVAKDVETTSTVEKVKCALADSLENIEDLKVDKKHSKEMSTLQHIYTLFKALFKDTK